MSDVRGKLVRLLEKEGSKLSSNLCRFMRTSTAVHYNQTPSSLLVYRCDMLVESLREAVRSNLFEFTTTIEATASERYDECYLLEEVQLALTTLEELMWRACNEYFDDRKELTTALSLISYTIGNAKDHLARIYVTRTEETVNPLDEYLLSHCL